MMPKHGFSADGHTEMSLLPPLLLGSQDTVILNQDTGTCYINLI